MTEEIHPIIALFRLHPFVVSYKILEHIIHRYIMEHLNANRILDTNQFGFRVGHSCEQQLISMIEEIQSAMDCRHQVVVDIFRTGPNGPDWTEGIKFGPDRTKIFRFQHAGYIFS